MCVCVYMCVCATVRACLCVSICGLTAPGRHGERIALERAAFVGLVFRRMFQSGKCSILLE